MEQPPPQFLLNTLAPAFDVQHVSRPHVTLTFAQSLDGRIAGRHGKQLALSGPESILVTHWMRSMHDAILVGIGTALNDNPQLNTRLLPLDSQPRNPRPVVLDSKLRFPPTCKLLSNFNKNKGRRPWIFCSSALLDDDALSSRRETLEKCGAKIFSIDSDRNGRLSLPLLLSTLHANGIMSLMVEGGQHVISSFLACTPPTIDRLVITIAPILVGNDGVGVIGEEELATAPQLEHINSENFGRDTVIACRLLAS